MIPHTRIMFIGTAFPACWPAAFMVPAMEAVEAALDTTPSALLLLYGLFDDACTMSAVIHRPPCCRNQLKPAQ